MADPESPPTPPDAPGPPMRAVPIHKVREVKGDTKIPVQRSKVASTRAFRRIGADRLFGIFGIVFILCAAALLFYWPEPTPDKEPTYGVAWPKTMHVLKDDTVTVARDSPTLVIPDLEIRDKNVTEISLVVSWKDDVGDEGLEFDMLSFNLTGPPSANVTLFVKDAATNLDPPREIPRNGTVARAPNVRQVPAKTLSEAYQLLGDRSSDNGTGTWKLEIKLEYVGDDFKAEWARDLGECSAEANGTICIRDPGQSVRVVVTYDTYAVELKPE
jgi:hypothetical protein